MSNELLKVYDGLNSAMGALNATMHGFYACTSNIDLMPNHNDTGYLFMLVIDNMKNEIEKLNELIKKDYNQQ